MSENKPPNKIELSDEQKKGLIDLPNCELTVNYACKQPSNIDLENGKKGTQIKRKIKKEYDLKKIDDMLMKGFSNEELLKLCLYKRCFNPLYYELVEKSYPKSRNMLFPGFSKSENIKMTLVFSEKLKVVIKDFNISNFPALIDSSKSILLNMR